MLWIIRKINISWYTMRSFHLVTWIVHENTDWVRKIKWLNKNLLLFQFHLPVLSNCTLLSKFMSLLYIQHTRYETPINKTSIWRSDIKVTVTSILKFIPGLWCWLFRNFFVHLYIRDYCKLLVKVCQYVCKIYRWASAVPDEFDSSRTLF